MCQTFVNPGGNSVENIEAAISGNAQDIHQIILHHVHIVVDHVRLVLLLLL